MPDIDFREFFRENKYRIRNWIDTALIFAWACLRLILNLSWPDVLLLPTIVMCVVGVVRAVKLGYKYRIYWEIGRVISTVVFVASLVVYLKFLRERYVIYFGALPYFMINVVRNKV